MIPDQVGPYQIERKIGSGGMGTVYLGRHVESDRVAAVKVLPASLAREEGFVLRFTREIEAMQSVSNPHIVEIYESGVDDSETYYYAMEYVEGVTLNQYIRDQGRIPWRTVIELAIQICQALKSAHDAGVIHRDLKPSNLLITPDENIKLLDFGVAQVFASSRLTKTGGIIGTAEYMSPEQAQGRRATKKSDIYSLGAVMYAMLTARPPFSGQTSMEVIQKHRFGQFDRPRTYVPDIPHWLDDVVCQCLEKDPDKRYPDTYVLSLRLKEILKKVDLSISGTLPDDTAGNILDGTAETIVAGTEDPNAVGGTLMRDLIRAEIERAESGSALARYFDNTWVLILLLIAVIAGGVYWFQQQQLSPEERFARGQELFDKGTIYWPEARDEFLAPLIEEDPDRWEAEVSPMLSEILVEELKQDFGVTRLSRKRVHGVTDAQRFLRMAGEYYKLGDRVAAEQVLRNLYGLLEGDNDHTELRRAIGEILDDLSLQVDETLQSSDSRPLASTALMRAREMLKKGQNEEARSILRSLIELYDGDSTSQNEVDAARQLLRNTESSTQ
ncbi:serine/threonine protein kinase [Rubinisphaera margarita]|uniref:serine/threonine protein kinase n=1 Tax=Rubinisphaera margarita TaxID=2909586 RepID=UPI001EE79979|nr:serine/threonine-protein kinase [Rubinisphaera margarita]MCG6157839.1 serine/threonine protein kinase [Rubinisphaera margarita]